MGCPNRFEWDVFNESITEGADHYLFAEGEDSFELHNMAA